MKNLLFFILFPFFLFGQTKIGNDIHGKNTGDQLGWSTSISSDGNIIAVGASGVVSRNGYVQVFNNNNGSWQQLGSDILGENEGDFFGHAVSLSSDGTILAIGAYGYNNNSGYVKVYKYTNNNWTQLGTTIYGINNISEGPVGGNGEFEFGYSININSDGSILSVGAPKTDSIIHNNPDVFNHGAVVIFYFENNDWVNKYTLSGESEEDNFGNSVSLSNNGNTIAIGAYRNDGSGNNSGHTRIYTFLNNTWVQKGNDINGENAYDQSGYSVSLSGDGLYLAIGAPNNDGTEGNDIDSGHVRYFFYGDTTNNGTWDQISPDIDGEKSNDQFGYSVSLSDDGNLLAAGSIDSDANGDKSGNVRIFKRITGFHIQIGEDIYGQASGDQSGFSVSLSGDGSKLVIGAPFNDGNGGNSGHVRVYDLSTVLSSDDFKLTNFTIFPNPSSKQINVKLNDTSKLVLISIYNNLGQLIKSSQDLSIDTSNLSKGYYSLIIETNRGKAFKKFIIE